METERSVDCWIWHSLRVYLHKVQGQLTMAKIVMVSIFYLSRFRFTLTLGVSNSTSSNSNGINASINVNANITPNITIRVEMPQSDQSRPVTNGQTQQFNGAPGLPSEVMEQITNSVNRYNN